MSLPFGLRPYPFPHVNLEQLTRQNRVVGYPALLASGVAPALPTVTGAGSLAGGEFRVGVPLTITAGTATAANGGAISYAYRYRVGGTVLATTASYTPVSGDEGDTLVAEWRAIEAGGGSTAWQSVGQGVVLAAAPAADLTFGALTFVGEGEAPLAAADGTYGQFTVSGGVITPNTSPLTVGTVNVDGFDVVIEAGRRTVTGPVQFAAAMDAGVSGVTIGVRKTTNDYDITPAAWSGWFNDLAQPALIRAEDPQNKPVFKRFIVFALSADAPTTSYGNLTVLNIDGRLDVGTESKLTAGLTAETYIFLVENGYAARNITFDGCDLVSDAPVARLTGTRPTSRVNGIWVKGNAQNITIRNCTGYRLFNLAQVVASNFLFEDCNQTECWDDLLKIYTRGELITGLTIRNCWIGNPIGDHGYHPDVIHMSTDGGIHDINIDGIRCFLGLEGHLCPAWPTPPSGAAHAPDANSLYAANKTLLSTEDRRMIFMDASAAQRTVTLFDPASVAFTGRICVQAWFTPTNGVVIDASGYTLWNDRLQQNVTSYTLSEAWETVELVFNHVLDRWEVVEARPVVQGVFSNVMSQGIRRLTFRNSILALLNAGNGVRLDGTSILNEDITVENVSLVTSWPGDLLGSGKPNSAANGGPRTQFDINIQGTRTTVRNNIAGRSYVGSSNVPLGTSNTLATDVDQTVWTEFAAAFPVADVAVQQHMPTSADDLLTMYRPVSGGGVLAGDGPLAFDPANDTYNFGQHPALPIGPMNQDVTAPTVSSASYTAPDLDLTLSEAATVVWATSDTGVTPTFTVAGGWTGTTYETGSYAGESGANSDDIALTSTTPNGSRKLTIYAYDAAGNLSAATALTITVANVVAGQFKPLTATTFTSGTKTNSFTIPTTVAATGADWVIVTVSARSEGASGVVIPVTCTLDGGSVAPAEVELIGASNFTSAVFKFAPASVPAGTFDVVVASTTPNFNGVEVAIVEAVGAAADQSTALAPVVVEGDNVSSLTATLVGTAAGSWALSASISRYAITSITGATTILDAGDTGSGNTATFAGLAQSADSAAGDVSHTYTQTQSGQLGVLIVDVLF